MSETNQKIEGGSGGKGHSVRVADSLFDRIQARNGLATRNQSQMSKLTFRAESADVDPPSREPYVRSLKAFRERIVDAIQDLGDLHGIGNSARIRRLTDMLAILSDARKQKVPYGLGKFVRASVNELVSLREASTLGDLTDDQIDLHSTNFIVTQIDVLLAKEAELVRRAEESDDVFEGDVEGVLALAQAHTTLPGLGDELFVLARVPVIPIPASGFLAPKKIESLGFEAKDAGGYAILENQVVIGVSPSSPADIQSALKIFDSEALVLVDPRPQGKKGVLWFWVMREENLNKFSKAFPSNALKLQSWGLAI